MTNKLLLIIGSCIALSACQQQTKTITNSEFLHNRHLMKETLAWCNENSGDREALPNCVNVSQASRQIESMHDANGKSCYSGSDGITVDQDCIDNAIKHVKSLM